MSGNGQYPGPGQHGAGHPGAPPAYGQGGGPQGGPPSSPYGGSPGQPPGGGGYPPPQQPPRMAVPAAPRKRGRSKSLPIAVAAGLAIGVFGGLLIVRGTGSAAAVEIEDDDGEDNTGKLVAIEKDAGEKGDGDGDTGDDKGGDTTAGGAEGTADASTAAAADAPDAGAAGTTDTAGTTPDAGTAAVANATPDATAAPVITDAKVTFQVLPKPATEHANYALMVDDIPVVGAEHTVKLEDGKKRIKVTVTSPGYKKYSRRITIKADKILKVRLRRPGKSGGSGPGSLIDL